MGSLSRLKREMHTKTWREKKMPNTVPNMETGESLFACIYINLVRRQHVLVVDGDEGAEAGEGDEDGDTAEDEVDEGGEGVFALQEHELLVADLVHLRRRRVQGTVCITSSTPRTSN